MTRDKDEIRFLAAIGHFLRGVAVGAAACGVLLLGWPGVAGAAYPLTWHEAPVSLMMIPALLMMFRAMLFPQEKPGARVLLVESLAVLALLAPFGFAVAAVSTVVAPPETTGVHLLDTAMMLAMVAAIWGVLRAMRRRAWRTGTMPLRDDFPETWYEELDRLAASKHGGFPVALGCLGAGMLVADIITKLAIPTGWCGGVPEGSSGAAMLMLVVVASQSVPIPRGAIWALVVVGFAGGLAAVLAAWLLVGCAGVATWVGWRPDIVAQIVAAVTSVLVLFSYYLRASPDAESK